jgi:hypothetical protein
MTKLILSYILLVFTSSISYSQDSLAVRITGRILSFSDSIPIEKATIVIFKNSKAKYVLADNKGIFLISYYPIPDSIRISSVGFTELKPFPLPKLNNGDLNLGDIYLERSNIELAPVQVIGKKPLVIFEFNKIIYNVAADTENSGLNGLEVIQKAPLIEVVENNKLHVNGDKSFIVLLNGRNTGIISKNPGAFLKSIPANYLSKIEISTDPPAKYKIEGYDYVVNIITSKKIVDGIFGSVNTGINTFGGYDGGGLIMLKKRKISLTANPSFTKIIGREGEFYQSNTNISTQYKNIQSGTQLNKSNSFTGSAELTYEIDSLKLLSFNAYTSISKLKSRNNLNNTYYNGTSLYNNIKRSGLNNDDNGFNYYTLDYEVLKNRKRDILTISGKLFQNHFFNKVNYINNSITYNTVDTLKLDANTKGNEYTVQIDYSKFVNDNSTFEIGAKEIFRNYVTDNRINSLKNSTLDYDQIVSILYSSYSLRKKNNYYKIGLGLNHTKISFAENNTSVKTEKQFFNPLPFINYSRNLKKNRSLSLNYSLSTRRPGVSFISSAIKYSNIENLQSGNPELKPEIFHNVDLAFNTSLSKKPLLLGVYFKTSANSIVQIIKPYQDSLTLRTYNNSGAVINIGNTIYYSQTFFKKLTFRINSDIGYVRLSNNDNNLSNDGITYKIFLTVSYKLPWKLRFSSQNFIYSQTINLQGTTDYFSDLRFYLGRNFLNDNLNVGLSFYQPYSNKVKLESKYQDPQFINYSYNNFPARYIGISLSYDFGDFSKVMKRDKNKTINNDDIKQ